MKSYKRKQYLVDKGTFQYRFVRPFVISWFLAASFSTAFFNWLVGKEIESLLWKAHVTVQTTDQVIGVIFIYTIAVTLILVLAFVYISCRLVGKKTNGVAWRMVKDLRQVADGDFSQRIALRERDHFQEVAASLNDFLAEKAERYALLKKSIDEISLELRELRMAHAAGSLELRDLERLRGKVALLAQGSCTENPLAPAIAGNNAAGPSEALSS